MNSLIASSGLLSTVGMGNRVRWSVLVVEAYITLTISYLRTSVARTRDLIPGGGSVIVPLYDLTLRLNI